jgi:hypothetical protein
VSKESDNKNNMLQQQQLAALYYGLATERMYENHEAGSSEI